MSENGTLRKESVRKWGWGRLTAWVLLCVLSPVVLAATDKASQPGEGRSDMITIDLLKAHGSLERPAVLFFHDKHTDALARQGKDCLACHGMVNDRLTPAFGRTMEMSRQAVMQTFHDNCIACHKEGGASAQASGPVTCGACHVKNAGTNSAWVPIDLDQALHYRHVQAHEQKCEQCHHQYDEQSQKLVYIQGQEGACLYCHKQQAEENRISTRSAAHLACVSCHQQKTAAKQTSGPVQCAGCHDAGQQSRIERPVDFPRIQRNQPDMVMVRSMPVAPAHQDPPESDTAVSAMMAAVPFDHKAHEGYNATCKACHHADLQACAQCHTIEGSADGDQVKLFQAMHQHNATMSCVGCHNRQKEQPQCAGCHDSIPLAGGLASPVTCRACHLAPQDTDFMDRAMAMDSARSSAMAFELLAARRPVVQTVAADQIPETVTIRTLAQTYQGVELPHRRIVTALAQAGQEHNLAAFFHENPLTLCQGCHHNSPASLKPPQCGSCHGRGSEELNPGRPGLMAAYHQQCIACHENMGIEKPASRECTACHALRP